MNKPASTPAPPYYAVIFTSTQHDPQARDSNGYTATAKRMVELAQEQPGFLGIESTSGGLGITVSYWSSLDAIKQWKQNAEHLEAQRRGHQQWYSTFTTRIALVERDYSKTDD